VTRRSASYSLRFLLVALCGVRLNGESSLIADHAESGAVATSKDTNSAHAVSN
jgi:hypothetical protein